jgi:DNA polymerase-3 subunit epsilon
MNNDVLLDKLQNWQRYRTWQQLPTGSLKNYHQQAFMKRHTNHCVLQGLAVDFETTGLNARRDKILSIGWVQVEGVYINLTNYQHSIISIEEPIPSDNVVIHHITDDQSTKGISLKQAIDDLLTALTGKVLIAHHAQIERTFLNAACQKLYHKKPILQIIDTQRLAYRILKYNNVTYKPTDLHLSTLARHYNLPKRKQHHALNDALTTAELFLAQLTHQPFNQSTLGTLLI